MKKKIAWFLVSCLIVGVLGLASSGSAEEKKAALKPTGKEKVDDGKKMVKDALGRLVEKPRYGGTFTYGLAAEPANFDEAFVHITTTRMAHTNEILLTNDWTKGPTGTGEGTYKYNIVPELLTGCLAERWELDPAAGVTILHIRQGVHFHDKPPTNGREMDARDVEFSLKRSLAISTARNYQFRDYIYSVKALDKWKVEVRFDPNKTSEIWPIMTSHTRIVPQEAVDQYGDLQDWRNSVGTGPFMLVDYVPQTQLTFARNPNYWQNDPLHPENKLPYLDGMKEFIIPDLSTQLAAVRTHKIDWLMSLAWEDAQSLMKTSPELKYGRYLAASGSSIMWKLDNPEVPWHDLRVRRALSMAVDQKSIAEHFYGGNAEMLNWPVQPIAEFTDFFVPLNELPEQVRELFEYHPEKAKQLLTEAGYPKGFKATVICHPAMVDLMSIVKDMWSKAGVDLALDVKEYGVWLSLRYNHRFPEMLESGIHGQLPFRFIWERRGSMHNVSQVNDARMNAAIDAIDAAYYDMPKRNQLMREIVPYMHSQVWYLTLPIPYVYNFWTPWVKSYSGEWNIGLSDYFSPFRFIWLDEELKREMTGR